MVIPILTMGTDTKGVTMGYLLCRIVLYCIVLYCIVLFNTMLTGIPFLSLVRPEISFGPTRVGPCSDKFRGFLNDSHARGIPKPQRFNLDSFQDSAPRHQLFSRLPAVQASRPTSPLSRLNRGRSLTVSIARDRESFVAGLNFY